MVAPAGGVNADLVDEEEPLQGGADGDLSSNHSSQQAPLNRGGCWLLPQHTSSLIKVGVSTFSGDATPGKTEVSFEQWYHEVQCVKDHYQESVIWESITRS